MKRRGVQQQCAAGSTVQPGQTWNAYPLKRPEDTSSGKLVEPWARVNPGQYVRSAVQVIQVGNPNAEDDAHVYITERTNVACGCVDNNKLATSLKVLNVGELTDCVMDGKDRLDCVPYSMVVAGETPWVTDATGRPAGLVARQDHGKVFFRFVDASECETQVYRTAWLFFLCPFSPVGCRLGIMHC